MDIRKNKLRELIYVSGINLWIFDSGENLGVNLRIIRRIFRHTELLLVNNEQIEDIITFHGSIAPENRTENAKSFFAPAVISAKRKWENFVIENI